MKTRISAVVLMILSLATVAGAADAPRVFSHPDRIRYDGQCFTIEGKDTFIFSGCFHYFRCPKALWNDRFDKIKAAGFNAVETYVPWNMEEPAMPASVDDYSKVNMQDLDDYLTMAEQHGLYVILRPGPYICAEWDCGGFPQWLLTKKPADWHAGHMWLRSDDPIFVAWSKHWFHAVDQIAVKHQITHRKPGTGGIIVYQLENEYGGNQPDDVEVRYLHALGQQALDDGIDVPFMTCWTGVVRGSSDPILRQTYDSCNFYPRWNVDSIAGQIAQLRKQQPDAPLETTELQGGWFGNVGAARSLASGWDKYVDGCGPAQIQNLTLFAMQCGDRVTNYYMLFGGTNFGDWAPDGITTSYDYSAPIREVGGVGEKYQRVSAIGHMLEKYGPELARAVPIPCDVKTDQPDVTVAVRLAKDGNLFLFVRTNQHTEPRKGHAVVTVDEKVGNGLLHQMSFDYNLEPFGSKILYVAFDGATAKTTTWLPEPVPAIARPAAADLPAAVSIPIFSHRADNGPVAWKPLPDGMTLEQLGVYDRRYVFYRTHVTLTDEQLKNGPLWLAITAPQQDHLGVSINGQVDPSIKSAGSHAASGLKVGDNTIEITYENVGQPNGGPGMEEMHGIRKIEVQNPGEAAANSIGGWRMNKVDSGRRPWRHAGQLPEMAADFDSSAWPTVSTRSIEADQLDSGESAVFRTMVNISADQLKEPARIVLDRMDDAGWVFVNGQKVGQGASWADKFTFPIKLHQGHNSIAVLIHNTDGRGGLGPVHLEFGADKPGLPMEVGMESQGFAGKWWEPDVQPDQWSNAMLIPDAPLTWFKASFELPVTNPHVWVPWVARLGMSGNGFLYLNGHPLGRYWEVGPQHDFFLPECWLNFGPGKSNVLTICRRPTEPAAPFSEAKIVPVNVLAETRP